MRRKIPVWKFSFIQGAIAALMQIITIILTVIFLLKSDFLYISSMASFYISSVIVAAIIYFLIGVLCSFVFNKAAEGKKALPLYYLILAETILFLIIGIFKSALDGLALALQTFIIVCITLIILFGAGKKEAKGKGRKTIKVVKKAKK